MTDNSEPKPFLAILASVVWGLAFFPGLVGAALSGMMFDAPGSMENPVAWINALIIVSFPLLCLVAIVGSWIAFPFQKRRSAISPSLGQLVVAGLPLLPIAYVVVLVIVGIIYGLLSGVSPGLHETVIKH